MYVKNKIKITNRVIVEERKIKPEFVNFIQKNTQKTRKENSEGTFYIDYK